MALSFICVGFVNVCNALGDGVVVGFQWLVFKSVSKIALGCIVWGSLRRLFLADSVWI